jgi:hypothetical protein
MLPRSRDYITDAARRQTPPSSDLGDFFAIR